jgi:thiamine biosynthesis protein ThiI
VLGIEVREKAYLYGPLAKGLGGLPVGCNGRSVLLLSGGIDSPVAGYLMAKRGLFVDAVYFHTHPFTSERTREKVRDLALVLRRYIPGMRLFIVNFTPVQVKIKETAAPNTVTLMARRAMMRIAEKIALCCKSTALVTGECLGQVASQTPESLRFTGDGINLPVLRPLIGMDKNEIIALARTLATYEISIRPYDDCCTIFAPEHPLTKPDTGALNREYAALSLEALLNEAAGTFETIPIAEG